MLNIVLEEADESIDKAYKEGYKQATIELEPEVVYWKTLYEERKKNTFNTNLKFGLIGFGSGFLIGGITGFAIRINLN